MTIKFKISKKYKIPTINSGNICINEQKLEEFWKENDMGNKNGVYIFAMRKGHGAILPYYVGKASNGFKQECFTNHKIATYVNVLCKKGTPFMYFIYSRKSNDNIIKLLEKDMILRAAKINKNILNKNNISPKWIIEGITEKTKGPNTSIQKEFKKMMNI